MQIWFVYFLPELGRELAHDLFLIFIKYESSIYYFLIRNNMLSTCHHLRVIAQGAASEVFFGEIRTRPEHKPKSQSAQKRSAP